MKQLTPHVLAWQYASYPDAHSHRHNLWIHAVAVPLFLAGIAALLLAPVVAWWLALVGPAAMAVSLALQGRGHGLEAQAPQPFRSPLDFVVRLLLEQCVTFPRFVLSGGFARALRQAA
jgi:hypothetical protein